MGTSFFVKKAEILDAALAGFDTPAAIAACLLGDLEIEDTELQRITEDIAKVLRSVEFNREYQQAKEDIVGTALNSFKETVMENVREMKDLARTAKDGRVRYAANKDILDRIGLKPTDKSDVRHTLADYEKILKGLKKDESNGPETPTEQGGVVPETGTCPKGGTGGS